MLRHLDPILSPDLLYALACMGHGDEIVIADANFPAASSGPRCIRADGVSATAVLRATLGVMPLDNFVPDSAFAMQRVDTPECLPPTVEDFQRIINETADHPAPITLLERFAFYKRASAAFAVVQTGETRLYGNIIVKKGVIA